MQKKTFTLILTFLVTFLNFAIAQELTIKSLTADPQAIIAVVNEKKDLAGRPCGLVKVRLPVEGAMFDGCVTTVNKIGEYWVYMEDGSYRLTVKHANFHPLSINFRDYGIERIEGKRTYTLTLLLPESKEKTTQQFTIRYTPKDAIVIIDSNPYKGSNGIVTASLSVGQHDYLVTASGYDPIDGSIRLKATAPSSIRIELEKSKDSTPVTTEQHLSTENPAIFDAQLSATANTTSTSENVETFMVNGVSFNMVRVEGGTFSMGATPEQGSDVASSETPVHQVALSTYSIGETEVTQELWQAVMGSNPSMVQGDKRPVERVSWMDCQEFIQSLNRLTGRRFRLPSEAEWEYAARGGGMSCGYKYSGSDQADVVAWSQENSGDKLFSGKLTNKRFVKHNLRSHDVKQKLANELGLYDMSGNVWEWCRDWVGAYGSNSQTNPTGPSSGSIRVVRGGSFLEPANSCRSSYRSYYMPSSVSGAIGLRLAL